MAETEETAKERDQLKVLQKVQKMIHYTKAAATELSERALGTGTAAAVAKV